MDKNGKKPTNPRRLPVEPPAMEVTSRSDVQAALARAGLLLAAEGAPIFHPDRDLLHLMADFSSRLDATHGLIDQARRYTPGGRKYNALWSAAAADHKSREVLESEIAQTAAITNWAVIEKLKLALAMLPGGDANSAAGSIWQVPVSAIRDALALLCAAQADAM